jgi:hypothetical protein
LPTHPGTLLEGNLGSVSLPNLMQLISLEQKNALLTLNRVEIGQTAEMCFKRGHLIYAQVNALLGPAAMYRIIGWWTAGSFSLTQLSEHELPVPNVNSRLDFLLLEGMRLMDAFGQYRELLPQLTSAVSFTQAALDSFRWDTRQPPEWVPGFIRQLPRSFSIAQLHQACDWDEAQMAGLLKMLLATQAVRIHSNATELEDGTFEEKPQSTRYEAFAQVLMEYVGYDVAYGMLESALQDFRWDSLDGLTFGQLLDLCDRLCGGLQQQLDRKTLNAATKRIRARATSLIG